MIVVTDEVSREKRGFYEEARFEVLPTPLPLEDSENKYLQLRNELSLGEDLWFDFKQLPLSAGLLIMRLIAKKPKSGGNIFVGHYKDNVFYNL